MSTDKKTQIYFFLAVFLATLVLNISVFLPFITAIVLGLTLASVSHPLYKKLRGFLGGKKSIAALLTIVLIIFIILVPIGSLGVLVFKEASLVYAGVSQGIRFDFVEGLNEFVNENLRDISPKFNFDLTIYFEKILNFVVQNLGIIFSSVAGVIFSVFLALLAVYYLLKDGDKFKKDAMSLSPLADNYDEIVFNKLRGTVNSVVKGSLLVALIQGVLAGLGFLIFQVPSPALWGAIATFAALIPAVGTGLVIIPGVIYLFGAGNTLGAIGLLVWGILIVGTVDNFIRPQLIERGIKIHPFFILISVLGGIKTFGPIGFLLGPLLLSLMFSLIDIYREEFKQDLERR